MNKINAFIASCVVISGCGLYAHWTDAQAAHDAGKDTTAFTVKDK